MNRSKLAAGILASAVVLLAGVGVGTANAGPKPSVDPQLPTVITLPFLSTPVTLTVTTGPGGNIVSAELDTPDAFATDTVSPNKVKFESTDGALQVSVKSKGNEQRVTAKAGELATLVGTGKWSGDVFGDGQLSTVDYTVGDDAGNPTLSAINALGGAGITAEAGEPEMSVDDDHASARVSVLFTKDGQSRTLSIKVSVHLESDDDDDDDESGASLRISLGKLRGVPVDALLAAGDKTWTAALCDGVTTATVLYTVNEDGTLDFTSVDPADAEVKHDESNRIEIRFSGDERVRISSSLEDGKITVNIKERIRCRDAVDPTTNVTNTVADDDDDDDEDHDGDHHRGGDDDDHDDDHGGDGHDGGDDD